MDEATRRGVFAGPTYEIPERVMQVAVEMQLKQRVVEDLAHELARKLQNPHGGKLTLQPSVAMEVWQLLRARAARDAQKQKGEVE